MSKKSVLAKYLDVKSNELVKCEEKHYGLEVYSLGKKQYAIGIDSQSEKACTDYIKDNITYVASDIMKYMTKLDIFFDDSIYEESNKEAFIIMVNATCGMKVFIKEVILHAGSRGVFLAPYDGSEHEQENFLIYRLN